jgi:CsoR family transcriptional regulator, copper-sensing transcriptional repressor
MLAEERDCPDVLVQLAAVRAAVDKVCQAVLEDHVESCLIGPVSRRDVPAAWRELKRAFDVVF